MDTDHTKPNAIILEINEKEALIELLDNDKTFQLKLTDVELSYLEPGNFVIFDEQQNKLIEPEEE